MDYYRDQVTPNLALVPQSPHNTKQRLRTVIVSQTEVPELGFNRHVYARMKKQWLARLYDETY